MEVGWRRAYLLERLRTFSWVLAPLKGKKEKRTCIVEPKLASHEHVAHAEAPFVTGAHFSLSLPPFLLLLLSFLLSCLFVYLFVVFIFPLFKMRLQPPKFAHGYSWPMLFASSYDEVNHADNERPATAGSCSKINTCCTTQVETTRSKGRRG